MCLRTNVPNGPESPVQMIAKSICPDDGHCHQPRVQFSNRLKPLQPMPLNWFNGIMVKAVIMYLEGDEVLNEENPGEFGESLTGLHLLTMFSFHSMVIIRNDSYLMRYVEK